MIEKFINYSNKIKRILFQIHSNLKNPIGIIYSFVLVQIVFIISFFDINLFALFILNESNAIVLFKSRLSEIITLFGSAIAIFAIIFSIVQLKKEDEEVIPILFEEVYMFPFLGFSGGIIFDLITTDLLYLSNIINKEIFIKISILSVYFVFFEILIIIYIIYRVYKLLISDMLFEKFIELVKKEALETTTVYSNEKLIKLKKRLQDKYKKSLLENDLLTSHKITLLLIEIMHIKPYSYFVSDFNRNIYLIFEQSVNQGNRETCRNIINIIFEFWQYGIEFQNISLLKNISFLPYNFYELIENKNFQKIDIVEHLIQRMYEVFNFCLKFKYKENKSIDDLKLFNIYSKLFISSYNNILKRILEKRDFQSWKYGINYLKQLDGSDFESKIEYDLRYKLSIKEKEKNINIKEIKLLKDEIEQKEMLYKLIYLTQFGLYSWLVDLINRLKFDIADFELFSNEFNLENESLKELIEVLLIFIKIDSQKFEFGWQNWSFQSEERLPGKVYWTPSTSDWMIFGFVIKLIKDNRIQENDGNELGTLVEAEQFEFIDETINRQLDYIKENYDSKFIFLLGLSTEDLQNRINHIISFFSTLKFKHIDLKKRAIAYSPLSDEKVNEFKEKMLQQWVNSNFVESLFKYYNSKIIYNPEIELKKCYSSVILKNGKCMFIDINYCKIFGLTLGNEISKSINNNFYTLLFNQVKYKKSGTRVCEEIDNSILAIKNRNFNPNLIIIHFNLRFIDLDFWGKLKFPIENKVFIGNVTEAYYNDKLIFIVQDFLLENKIVVADFDTSFEMSQRTDINWLNSLLNVKVTEITKEIAEIELKKQKEQNDKNEDIDHERELIEIMNNIKIEVSEIIEFKVKNIESFEIINII